MAANEDNYADIAGAAQNIISLISKRNRRPGEAGGQNPAVEGRASVQSEIQRAFPGFYRRDMVRSKRRPPALSKVVPAVCQRYIRLQFCLLSAPAERTPTSSKELELQVAGMGKSTLMLSEDSCHDQIVKSLEDRYPKIRKLSGSWLIYKASGGQGQRKLNILPTEAEGYTALMLKNHSSNGKHVLFIVPLQEELDCTPLPHNSPEFAKMPKATCKTCKVAMPLQFLALHIESCQPADLSADEGGGLEEMPGKSTDCDGGEDDSMASCPICGQLFLEHEIQLHASFCGDPGEGSSAGTLPVSASSSQDPDWKQIKDPSAAATLFRRQTLRDNEGQKSLRFVMDLHSDIADREKAVIAFYKTSKTNWASPLKCILEGDIAVGDGVTRYFLSFSMHTLQNGFHLNYGMGQVTLLFEGQRDHRIPCASQVLLDSDLFIMAGRMIGHSFLHNGPTLAGMSPAVIHILLGGPIETATITPEDCPDLDNRQTISLLDGNTDLSEDQTDAVAQLTDMWDLPKLNAENQRYLHEQMLQRAVIGRVNPQIKQLRKGLKETNVWQILSQRPDVAELVFPREGSMDCNPKIILEHITWPLEESVDDEDDEEEFPLNTRSKIASYLREFIERAPTEVCKNLMKFWTGWEVPTGKLQIEVVQGEYPKSSTCMQTLKLPGHFTSFESFRKALQSSIDTTDFGFGLI